MTRTNWRTRAYAVEDEHAPADRLDRDEHAPADRLDRDALDALTDVGRLWHDGMTDPLYALPSLVVWWPGGHDVARAVADTLVQARDVVAELSAGTDVDPDDDEARDVAVLSAALPSLLAIRHVVSEAVPDDVADLLGTTLTWDAVATNVARALVAWDRPGWTVTVGTGFSKGTRLTATPPKDDR